MILHVKWQTRRVPNTRLKPDGYMYKYEFSPRGYGYGYEFIPATPLLTGG
jgi:hypothetical protein